MKWNEHQKRVKSGKSQQRHDQQFAHNKKNDLSLPFSSMSRHDGSRAARSHRAATGCGASVAISRLDRKITSQGWQGIEAVYAWSLDESSVLLSPRISSPCLAQLQPVLVPCPVAEPESLQLQTRISCRRCTAEPAVFERLEAVHPITTEDV